MYINGIWLELGICWSHYIATYLCTERHHVSIHLAVTLAEIILAVVGTLTKIAGIQSNGLTVQGEAKILSSIGQNNSSESNLTQLSFQNFLITL